MHTLTLNSDWTQRCVVDSTQLPWQPSPSAQVHRKLLERNGGEVARATSIVRYEPGARAGADAPDQLWVFFTNDFVLLQHKDNADAIKAGQRADVVPDKDVRLAVGALHSTTNVTVQHMGGGSNISSSIDQVLQRGNLYTALSRDSGQHHILLLSQIDCKLVGFWPDGPLGDRAMFMPYTNISKLM